MIFTNKKIWKKGNELRLSYHSSKIDGFKNPPSKMDRSPRTHANGAPKFKRHYVTSQNFQAFLIKYGKYTEFKPNRKVLVNCTNKNIKKEITIKLMHLWKKILK